MSLIEKVFIYQFITYELGKRYIHIENVYEMYLPFYQKIFTRQIIEDEKGIIKNHIKEYTPN